MSDLDHLIGKNVTLYLEGRKDLNHRVHGVLSPSFGGLLCIWYGENDRINIWPEDIIVPGPLSVQDRRHVES